MKLRLESDQLRTTERRLFDEGIDLKYTARIRISQGDPFKSLHCSVQIDTFYTITHKKSSVCRVSFFISYTVYYLLYFELPSLEYVISGYMDIKEEFKMANMLS